LSAALLKPCCNRYHFELQQNHLEQWAQVYYSVGWRQAVPCTIQTPAFLSNNSTGKYWGRLAAVLVRGAAGAGIY